MKKFIFALAAIMTTPTANAQSGIPPVHVFTHSEHTAHQNCEISLVSAMATVKAALRDNRIEVVGKEDFKGFAASFNIKPIYLKSYDLCATSVELKFYGPAFMPSTTGEKSIRRLMDLCSRSSIFTGSPYNAQDSVNASLRENVDICVSELETMLKE